MMRTQSDELLRTHWNEQMALELALEVSCMQEMTLLLARVRFSEQTPRCLLLEDAIVEGISFH